MQKFAAYTMDTAKLYIDLYSWHPMSPTLLKVLIHGPVVIQNALLPIGQLTEEVAEARNKHFRLYRLKKLQGRRATKMSLTDYYSVLIP